jgi:hypothetical protein
MRTKSLRISDHSNSTRVTGILLAWLLIAPNLDVAASPGTYDEGAAQPGDTVISQSTQGQITCLPLGEKPAEQKAGDSVKAEHHAQEWGDITIAAPKIWQYERVNTYLDGLLRDVEAVSLSDLTQLDPNAQNAGAIQFIQSALEVGVQYNQASAVNNNLLLQSWNTQTQQQLQQLQRYNTNIQSLEQQRNDLIQQLAATTSTVNALQTQQLNGTTLTSAQQTQLNSAQSFVSTLNSELANVNSAIQSAGPAPTMPAPPTLQTPTVQGPASGTSMSSTFYGLTDLLNKLPPGIQNELTSALQSPSYPATARLDSFITLLHERLAREVSALQDDLTRDPNTMAYLVQFDVGLYPASRTKNHMARVEFELDQNQCPGCKVYSIYPGQSSYNVANYKGESRSKSFWGNLSFLIGLGISAAYRQQEDTLHSSLVQSVYTSGFQDDTLDRRDPSKHLQRFGWNYGSAPFEMYVSPGIRTTFAIITVPRHVVSESQRSNRASANELPPGTFKSVRTRGVSTTTTREGDVTETITTQGSVTTTTTRSSEAAQGDEASRSSAGLGSPMQSCFDLDINAYWGLRDNPFYNKAHFLIPSQHVDPSRLSMLEKSLTVELPGTAGIENLPRAVQFEPNQLHVTSMEYNPVYSDTPSSSPTAAATSTPAVSPSGQSSYSMNACAPGQCAAVVLALDQPIDPNLVVTVNGTVLARVRDWRGRATSILPAPESGSDLLGGSGATATGGTSPIAGSQNQPQRLFRNAPGLLESDQLGPDTWYALDSHRLLLTISRQIAPEEEFPIIRLADPSRDTLTLPNQLDQGFSEIITSGFHLPARTQEQLSYRIHNRFSVSPSQAVIKPPGVQSAGPYPAGTFLPLFLKNPEPQGLYAYLGETGRQILVGFEGDSLYATSPAQFHEWLPSRDQVVLEDRNLDLAWSLDCSPQAANLVCDIPQQQIATAYEAVRSNCSKDDACSAYSSIADFPFVSSLELWVEQYDPDKNDAFYSASPILLGLFPVQKTEASTDPLVNFVPWRFESADPKRVIVRGCGYSQYFMQHRPGEISVNALRILGRDPEDRGTDQTVVPTDECSTFKVPTDAIAKDDVVFVPIHINPVSPNTVETSSKTPITIASAGLRPFFGRPVVTPTWNSNTPAPKKSASFPADCWTLDFTAGRLDFGDQFSNSSNIQDLLNITWPDQSGLAEEPTSCPVPPKTTPRNEAASSPAPVPKPPLKKPDNWDHLSREGRIHVRMVILRADLPNLPKEIPVLRGDTPIAKLRIPQILLPSKVKLEQISATQFALRGENVNMIDAVTLQDGKNIYTIPTAVGADFALVTLPDKTSSNPASNTGGTSPTITSVALDPSGKYVLISGQGFGNLKGRVTFDGTRATSISEWIPTSIKAALPAGKKPGDTIKVEVTAAQQSSTPADFTVGKTFTTDCTSATNGPCIAKVAPDASGENVIISGQGFGDLFGTVTFDGRQAIRIAAWNDTSVTVALPAGEKAGALTKIKVISAPQSSDPFSFTIGASASTTRTASGGAQTASQSPAQGNSNQPTTSVAAGTYAVVPLFRISGSGSNANYVPLEASGDQDKPLVFTVASTPAKPATPSPPSATTTITVTKTPPTSTGTSSTPSSTPQTPQNPQ